jgi:hypothetical protein
VDCCLPDLPEQSCVWASVVLHPSPKRPGQGERLNFGPVASVGGWLNGARELQSARLTLTED